MANVIKHKRGSGSDPSASDLILGELAIRTDTGKLFTKMDSGAIAEIAGGGSDIAINTLSSSSGTGGGSATFNGSAYRFTLSAPPNVSAAQLLVSINGVIQKPVAGTGQPSEGFSVDGTDIILGDAPATGSDFFILTFKSLGVSEPADNSVTSAKIVDGAIVNADINASAAIAGTKISPNFGSQNLVTDGTGSFSFIQINAIEAKLTFNNLYSESDFSIRNNNGDLQIIDIDNSDRVGFQFGKNGTVTIPQNTDFGAGIDVTGAITGTGDLTIDTNTLHVDSSNNRVGIGTTSPAVKLDVNGATTIRVANSTSYQSGLNVSNSVTTDLQVWIKNNAVALGPSTASDINFVTGGNTGTRLTIASNGDATFSRNLILEGGSNHAYPYIELHSSATSVRKWRILGGQPWNPDALLIYDIDEDNTTLTIETNKLGINRGANSLTHTLDVGGTSMLRDHVTIDSGILTFGKSSYGDQDNEDFYRIKFFDTGGIANDVGIGQPDSSSLGFNVVSSGTIRFYRGTANEHTRFTTASEFRVDHGNASESATSSDPVHGIGNTSLDTVTTNLARLVMQERQGNWISFKTGGGTHYGTISRNGSFVVYGGQSSDYRIKENVVNVSNGITLLKQLRPVNFNYTSDSGFTAEELATVNIGFIAHEFAEICPNGVIGEKDGMDIWGDCTNSEGETTQTHVPESKKVDGETWTEKSRKPNYQQIDFSKAVPILTAALQEAIARIEALEAK